MAGGTVRIWGGDLHPEKCGGQKNQGKRERKGHLNGGKSAKRDHRGRGGKETYAKFGHWLGGKQKRVLVSKGKNIRRRRGKNRTRGKKK